MIKNSTSELGPGLDVRGEGGYVVAPPSIHHTGQFYQWENRSCPLATAPKWLTDLAVKRSPGTKKILQGGAVTEGGRNSRLTSVAGVLRAQGADGSSLSRDLAIVNGTLCDPPLSAAEVEGIARSVARYDAGFTLTDVGNGKRFANQHGNEALYCHSCKAWLFWDGKRFQVERGGEAIRRAKAVAASIYAEAVGVATRDQNAAKAVAKHAAGSQQKPRIEAMLCMAQSELPIEPSDLDRDDNLFNVENGTIDLRNGALREHRREDRITKLAPVVMKPDAKCPIWEGFLDSIYGGDPELIGFVQRAVGYSLTGLTVEQVLFLLYGCGANGKSTFLETLLALLGDYARPTEFRTVNAGLKMHQAAGVKLHQ